MANWPRNFLEDLGKAWLDKQNDMLLDTAPPQNYDNIPDSQKELMFEILSAIMDHISLFYELLPRKERLHILNEGMIFNMSYYGDGKIQFMLAKDEPMDEFVARLRFIADKFEADEVERVI